MVTEERLASEWGPRLGEDWRAHRMRVFADYPEQLAVLRLAESREHVADIWRGWSLRQHEGDPELQAFIREAKVDLDAPPEMDEEDIRPTATELASNERQQSVEGFLRYLAAQFPNEAEDILSGL